MSERIQVATEREHQLICSVTHALNWLPVINNYSVTTAHDHNDDLRRLLAALQKLEAGFSTASDSAGHLNNFKRNIEMLENVSSLLDEINSLDCTLNGEVRVCSGLVRSSVENISLLGSMALQLREYADFLS